MSVNYVTTRSGIHDHSRHYLPHGTVILDQERRVHGEYRHHLLGHVHLRVTVPVAFREWREHGHGVAAVSQRLQHRSHHVPVALARDRLNRQDVCGTRRRPLDGWVTRIKRNQQCRETGHDFFSISRVVSVFRETVIQYRSVTNSVIIYYYCLIPIIKGGGDMIKAKPTQVMLY